MKMQCSETKILPIAKGVGTAFVGGGGEIMLKET